MQVETHDIRIPGSSPNVWVFKAMNTLKGKAGINDSIIISNIPNKIPPFEITSVLYSTIVFIKSKLSTFLFYYNTKIEMSQENSS